MHTHAGINTAIYSPSGANSGVGFAIPVDIVRSSVDQIIRFGRVIRPILGISFAPDQSSEQVSVHSLPEYASFVVLADKTHSHKPECCLLQHADIGAYWCGHINRYNRYTGSDSAGHCTYIAHKAATSWFAACVIRL